MQLFIVSTWTICIFLLMDNELYDFVIKRIWLSSYIFRDMISNSKIYRKEAFSLYSYFTKPRSISGHHLTWTLVIWRETKLRNHPEFALFNTLLFDLFIKSLSFLGIWFKIINFINICGVISNGFLIAFTSEIGREQPLYMKFAIVIAFEVSLSGLVRVMCEVAFCQTAPIRSAHHKFFLQN